jgi:uncharacterized membrane protein
MAPLVVMVVVWGGSRIAGAAGWQPAASITGSLRFGLAALFLFTAISHFHPRTRSDLIRMVPPLLPVPGMLVTSTGLLELSGAIGLLLPGVTTAAAYGLMALLVALFPANVYAARSGLGVAGRQPMPLAWRAAVQMFWISSLWCVA